MSRKEGRLDDSVYLGTSHIPDNSISTAKLADDAVTQAKLSSFSYQSGSNGGVNTTSTSRVDTTLTVTITTTGRPVFIKVLVDSLGFGQCNMARTATSDVKRFYLMRDSTDIASMNYSHSTAAGSAQNCSFALFNHVDFPSAGTYTYKFQVVNASAGSSPSILIQSRKLIAYEL